MKGLKIMRKLSFVFYFLLIFTNFLLGKSLQYRYNFEKPFVENNLIKSNLSSKKYISGNPIIPYYSAKILLPFGTELSDVKVNHSEWLTIQENIFIDFAKTPQPISSKNISTTQKNNKIYKSDNPYPSFEFEILETQILAGHYIAFVNLFPYRYLPKSGILQFSQNLEINISLKQNSKTANYQSKMLCNSNSVQKKLERLVGNFEENISYFKKGQNNFSKNGLPSSENPYQMIIITDEQRKPFFSEFIEWKNQQGIETGIFVTSDIYAYYGGIDNQAKIRNFILDAYIVYSQTDIPLEYVFLGGDDEIIPIRGAYGEVGEEYVDSHIPCDLYYGCLDGNWDADGDGIYGEVADSVDMLPEVAVGRIPAETQTEFSNFFDKNYSYVENTTVSNDIIYMVGENLDWDPGTWGADYKNEIIPIVEDSSEFKIFTLYQKDGNYSGDAVKNAINSGFAIMNHLGHSNHSFVFGQNNGYVNSYTNDEFGFAYTQGCSPAAFDENTSHESEAIGENFVKASNGLFAFIGNTRYGWYMPGSTEGASQFYDIEFFNALFNENIRQLGNALDYSKEVLVDAALDTSQTVMRWVYYELVLFGDPSISLKDANGNFPFLQPVDATIDDVQGDSDGNINPGETININVTIENLEDWNVANNVSAIISFEDDTIQLVQDSVYYGEIANGDTLSSPNPFVINIPTDCNYDSYTYFLDVSAQVSDEIYFNKTYSLDLNVSLFQQNWPWASPFSINSNPIITDFNSDGTNDILSIDVSGNVNLLNIDAEQNENFPWNYDENIWKSIAFGDIDGDENEDIVIASRTGRIFAIDNQGDLIFDCNACFDQQLLTPIISDVAGDNSLEIISFGIDRKLFVLNSAGQVLDGFPIEFSNISIAEMASADINQNGKNEILIGTLDGKLNAIDESGGNISGFPVEFSAGICAAPTVLDNYKIVLGTSDNKVHIRNQNGEILVEKNLESEIANSVIAADFDDDTILEIAFTTQNGGIYIIEQDGSNFTGWPIFIDERISNPPLAVDLNGDDNLDLLCFAGNSDFFAYNSDGSEIDFAPVPIGLIGNIPASIEDIDNDGDFDILSGSSSGIFILDSKLPKGTKIPWNTYRGNYQRTGFYGDNIITNIDTNFVQNQNFYLYQNYPNPCNSFTNISFYTSKSLDNPIIKIFNIKGQLVKQLKIQSPIKLGTKLKINKVIWDGTDKNNESVASGIYFYKLFSNNYCSSVKKLLLLK